MEHAVLQNDLIIDVGLHKGMDTEFYLKKGFRVAAVEANPAMVELVSERLAAHIDDGRLKIYNVGIYDSEGVFDFYVNKDKDDWSSVYKDVGARQNTAYEVIKVNFVRFGKILAETGIPYYLKIDIEHADILALSELNNFDVKPKYVSCEAHSIDIFFEMRKLGYQKFKLVNQRTHHKHPLPNPPLEGLYVDEKFTGIHSGPFGEETPGPWMTIEEAIYEWLHKRLGFVERSILGEGWYDVHATFE